jgi:hypothetical protein
VLRSAGLPGEAAAFYLLATDLRAHGHDTEASWDEHQRRGSRGIVIWESGDLMTWSNPRLVEIAPATAGNAWAPEAVFDSEKEEYFVFWASKLYEPGAERQSSYNRMLAATTRDFRDFSDPFIWSDPGWSVIDATLVREGEWWYRFVKDERSPASDTPAAKFITVERSRDLHAPRWELVQNGIGSANAHRPGIVHGEGPIVIPAEDDGPVVLLVDEFGLRRYIPFLGSSLDTDRWDMAAEYVLPRGSVLAITDEEWNRLSR